MDIIDFLKNEPGARLTYGHHWMLWDDDDQWKVYKGIRGIGKILVETTDEEEAIAKLIY